MRRRAPPGGAPTALYCPCGRRVSWNASRKAANWIHPALPRGERWLHCLHGFPGRLQAQLPRNPPAQPTIDRRHGAGTWVGVVAGGGIRPAICR